MVLSGSPTRWDRWYIITLHWQYIPHLYTTYSPCLLGDYVNHRSHLLREPSKQLLTSVVFFPPRQAATSQAATQQTRDFGVRGDSRPRSPTRVCHTEIWVENSGWIPPKSSIFIGFSIINHPFWGTNIFGNTYSGLEKTNRFFWGGHFFLLFHFKYV